MVLDYIAFPVDGLVWGLPMWAEEKLRDYRDSKRNNLSVGDPAISKGLAEDALLHCVSYTADVDGLGFVECLRWPSRIAKKLGEYKSSGNIDFNGDLAVTEGLIAGFHRLHHLMSAMEYELPQTERHKRQEEEMKQKETHVDILVRKVKTATALTGFAGYVAAAVVLTPWALAPLAVSNMLDCVMVYHYPREVFDDPYSGV